MGRSLPKGGEFLGARSIAVPLSLPRLPLNQAIISAPSLLSMGENLQTNSCQWDAGALLCGGIKIPVTPARLTLGAGLGAPCWLQGQSLPNPHQKVK